MTIAIIVVCVILAIIHRIGAEATKKRAKRIRLEAALEGKRLSRSQSMALARKR